MPGLDAGAGTRITGQQRVALRRRPRHPAGAHRGYVFPLSGPHNFGEAEARFGASRYGHVHEGQDIFGKTGTPEVAVHDGLVVDRGKNSATRDSGGRGNYLAIYSSADNHSFVYMHMLKPSPVQVGDQVHAGQLVGQLGCTGSCDGPHLHFEVRVGKATLGAETKPVDPLPLPAAVAAADAGLSDCRRAANRIAPCPRSPTSGAAPPGCSPSTGPSAATRSIPKPPTSCSRPTESSRATTMRGS